MSIRRIAAVLFSFMLATTAVAHAQGPDKAKRGQLASELAKLQQAQSAFFKRYAADDAFAEKFNKAIEAKDAKAASALGAEASGMAANNVDVAFAELADLPQYASAGEVRLPTTLAMTSGKICFNVIIAKGCVIW